MRKIILSFVLIVFCGCFLLTLVGALLTNKSGEDIKVYDFDYLMSTLEGFDVIPTQWIFDVFSEIQVTDGQSNDNTYQSWLDFFTSNSKAVEFTNDWLIRPLQSILFISVFMINSVIYCGRFIIILFTAG